MGFLKKYYDSVDKYRPLSQAGGLTIFDVIRPIYESGSKDGEVKGRKQGYIQASNEYEKKLLKQGEEFLKQTKIFESDKVRYEKLIDDYERYIDEMMQKNNMSNQEKDYMNQIMVMERKLKKLK